MVKIVSMMKRKEGMSIEDFRDWALNKHPQIGKELPGIRHYRVSVVLPEHADSPYDAANELYFDSHADFVAALQTEIGARAGADIKAHCADDRFRIVAEEKTIIE